MEIVYLFSAFAIGWGFSYSILVFKKLAEVSV
ncbi:hypothetical protein ArsFIN_21690 [Arsenophonus nasoniae]|uniref:Uncharacterized protein n=1 Tax=Arsenophonus nasoniae TaxID=638 RepID=A0A4P7KUB0_9GAMM|nr:hypothetical protein ArsFIN_21690 [Arsenophonus nasoniae]